MRFLYTLTFLFFILFSSFAQITDYVSTTSLSYSSPSTGTQTFNINCNPAASWTVSAPTWINSSFDRVSGTGPATITVNVEDNPSFDQARSDEIHIVIQLTSITVDRWITITQTATPTTPTPTPTLTLSTDLINVPGGSTAFTFTSDESWTVTMDSWLVLTDGSSVEITSGSAGATNLNVVADPNPTTSLRIGTITFTSGSTSKNLTIFQDGASTPTLSLSTPSINASNGSTAFTFTSDDSWTATMDSWLGLTLATSGNLRITTGDITSGSAGTTNLIVVADPNPTTSARTGSITFTSGSVSKVLTVTQDGATTTGIMGDASTQANDFIVYPNPSNDIFNIELSNPSVSNSIKITNSAGIEVYSSLMNQSFLQVNRNILGNNGLYLIKIVDSKGNILGTKKLILE